MSKRTLAFPMNKLTENDCSASSKNLQGPREIGIFQLEKTIQGIKLEISNPQFTDTNTISVKLNGNEYLYKLSRSGYKGKSYFTCVNRYKGNQTNRKCLAKLHYDINKNEIDVVDLHNPNCAKTDCEAKVQTNLDYFTQKEDIVNSLSQKESLNVTSAIDMLREKNILASPKSKRVPLKYAQVKKITYTYKQDNNYNSHSSIDNFGLIKTIDGALFRRCHNKYDLTHKSKL